MGFLDELRVDQEVARTRLLAWLLNPMETQRESIGCPTGRDLSSPALERSRCAKIKRREADIVGLRTTWVGSAH